VGIRQTLNDNPVITTSVTGLIILVAVFVLFRSACSSSGGGAAGVSTKQYYTIDDGKNYFPADASKIPPFTHEGKPAYRVKVYKCPDGTTYVSHLERYNEADRKRLQEAADKASANKSAGPPMDGLMLMGAMEVKKPGDKDWVTMKSGAEKYMAVMRPRCPDGSVNVTVVTPPE
jgi:hypothetical protein